MSLRTNASYQHLLHRKILLENNIFFIWFEKQIFKSWEGNVYQNVKF